jgi:hypothetical protein
MVDVGFRSLLTYAAAILSSLLPFPPSWVQIFSSAPCSQILLVCAPPLVQETKSLIHTKQEVKLWLYILIPKFLERRWENKTLDKMVASIP